MFAPCPHCGYLIALIATRERTTLECPRCHNLVDPAATLPPVRSVPQPVRADPSPVVVAPDVPASPSSRPASTDPTNGAASPRANDTAPGPANLHAADANEAGDEADVEAGAVATRSQVAPKPTSDAPHPAELPEPAAEQPTDANALDAGVPTDADLTAATPSEDTAQASPSTPASTRNARIKRGGAAPRRASPSFIRPTTPAESTRRGHPRRWPALLACLALALLLTLQLLLAQRDVLARSAQWRPLIAGLCSAGLCTLPPWRDPAAFSMLSRNVAPIAGTRELLVDARFRNDAPWPQAWPHLHLVLSDAQGRPVAARVLAPREYAGAAAQRPIAPQQSVEAHVRIREPEPATVAFAFDFR